MARTKEEINATEYAALEERVVLLIENAKGIPAFIEAHDFDLAALAADALAVYCRGARDWSNRLANNMENDG